ncbi:MAG TPA: hypothetical protein VK968_00700 [Roseimicrobium sp.]|nr:hypothetical protein [Roseimicrobium sp.]
MKLNLHRCLLLGIFGLWPFWVALIWVLAAAIRYTGSQNEFWSGAPWILIAAAPVCVVTTLLGLAADYVHRNSEGGSLRRVGLATAFYLGALGLLGLSFMSMR